ncbi:MAG: hypothetical protein LBR80_04575 [Deltaproteobacteria bacterium]|nr:hypothetical protein [Deltaproteobacteria bacterium]
MAALSAPSAAAFRDGPLVREAFKNVQEPSLPPEASTAPSWSPALP